MTTRFVTVGDALTLPPSVQVPAAQVAGLGTAAAAAAEDFDAAGTAAGLVGALVIPDSPDDIGAASAAHTHAPEDVTGTAVITTDARLSDARTPLAHSHTLADVTDAGDAAGLDVGTTAGTVMAGDDSRVTSLSSTYVAQANLAVTPGASVSGSNTGDQTLPTWDTIGGKPSVVAAGDTQADARTAIGLGSAATTASTDYATATQGNTADAAIPKSVVAAKGDVMTAAAASTPARLAVGTDGQTVTADSSTATGLAWEHRAPRVGLYLPDVAGNYVGTPDSATLNITGDIDIAWHGALDAWTGTAATQILVGKYLTEGNQRSYYLGITATGRITITYSRDGATAIARSSTIATGLAAGQESWVRATLDADNGAGGQDASFYTSVDGVTWTRLGTTVTVAITAEIFASTAPLEVNGIGSAASNRAIGVHMGARVCAGIDSAPVASWDGRVSHTRQQDSLGNIWTVSGSTNAWRIM